MAGAPSPINQRTAVATAIAVALAVPAEGIRRVAYYDPPGILTVCRGHTGPDVRKDKVYSLPECDAFMDADMRKAVALVEKCAPGLPPNVLAAFADAVYNMGPKVACDTRPPPDGSTAARYLKAGLLPHACDQLLRWDKAKIAGQMVSLPGLTKRRQEERAICLAPFADQGITL
jgi:lysozyme